MGEPCASATTVAADPTAVRAFLQERMQVYSLRSSSNGDQGLITGYYEPVYHGSLSQGEKTPVPVYGVPDDLVVVALESVYPELKGKRLRGRLEGRVLKPYDDAATIRDNGSSAPVLAWLGDPMDLQFLQIQGSGASSWKTAGNCGSATATRMATRTSRSAAGWSSRAWCRRKRSA